MKKHYSHILLSLALLCSSTMHSMNIPQLPKIKLDDIKDNAIAGLAAVTVLLTCSVIYLMKQVAMPVTQGNPAGYNSLQLELGAAKTEITNLATKLTNLIAAIGVEQKSGDTILVTRLEVVEALVMDSGAIDRRLKELKEGQEVLQKAIAARNGLDAIYSSQASGLGASSQAVPQAGAAGITEERIKSLIEAYVEPRFTRHGAAIKYLNETQQYMVDAIAANHDRLVVGGDGVLSLNHKQGAAVYDNAINVLKKRISEPVL